MSVLVVHKSLGTLVHNVGDFKLFDVVEKFEFLAFAFLLNRD